VVGASRIIIGAPAADDGLGAADEGEDDGLGATDVLGAGAEGLGAADVTGAGAVELAGAGGFAEGVGVGDGDEQLPRTKAAITRIASMTRANFFIGFLLLDLFPIPRLLIVSE